MQKLTKIILISFLVVLAISLIDIFALKSQIFGSYEQYTSGDFPEGWWFLFRNIVLLIIAVVSLVYYLLYKDKSEAVSIGLGSYILWMTGLADVLYFWLQGNKIPKSLLHLNNQPIISSLSEFFGYSQVTGSALLLSSFVGIIIVYFLTKFLKEKL